MLLDVRDLNVSYPSSSGRADAVRGVSFNLAEDRTLALVGESGAGKTSVGLAILGLLPGNAQVSGQVIVQDNDVLQMRPNELRAMRGRIVSMVFQDPATGLNPVLTIGSQVSEVLTNHLGISKKEAKQESVALLRKMGIRDAEGVIHQYPFHLSGGMAQRVMIGIAMALEPRLMIADEATSALDVTVQAGILAELRRLREQSGTSILLITHDLGVVAQMADDVAVMYAGHIVEQGTASQVFRDPTHPYTEGLLATRPRLDSERMGPLRAIRPPADEGDFEELCPFLPRCHKALSRCRVDKAPALVELEGRHKTACYNPVIPT
ncbi:MAG: ABC transporter ATP-binding protein [Dehalococcoidia bacterium]